MGDLLGVPLIFAFSAGMLATVNPCGFAMLPSFVAYYLGADEAGFGETPVPARLLQGLAVGLTVTLGFLLVFSMVGLVLGLGGRALLRWLPWAALAVGIGLVLLGVRLLLGKAVVISLPSLVGNVRRRGFRPMFLYGIGYAVASLSCTLPIFLVVVGGSLAAVGLVAAIATFVAYGLGMGTVLMALAVGAAVFRGLVAQRLRVLLPCVERLSALLLVAAGGYLIYYQATAGLVLTR